jgi:hypothetical protein
MTETTADRTPHSILTQCQSREYLAGVLADLSDEQLAQTAASLRQSLELVEAEQTRRQGLPPAAQPAQPAQPVRVCLSFPAYNQRRDGKPWIARVTAWPVGGRPELEWGRYLGTDNGGECELMAAPGELIRWGQKDHRRPDKSLSRWGVVDPAADGNVRDVADEAEARRLWAETHGPRQ